MRCKNCGLPITKLFDAHGICSLCLIEEQNATDPDFVRAIGATEFLDLYENVGYETDYDEITD